MLPSLTSLFRGLALVATLGSLALAQQVTGSLTAIVIDATGSVVPNAQVTLTNELSGDLRRTATNQEGYFAIIGIPPGTYTVTVEAKGFKTYKAEHITFNPGDRRTLPDIRLEVSATGTEVVVTDTLAELTPVDTGEKSVVISTQQLQNVAIVGRSAAEFIKILPGMAPIARNGVENAPGFNGEVIGINGNGDGGKQSALGNYAANGTRPEALDITADGAHVADPGCNCATPVNPNPDMIAEFKVQQSNFAAENSKGPVVMSSVMKSGGREFHGSAYFYARHFAMNSNDWLNNSRGIKKPENKFFFPGGNIGGPVLIPGTSFNKNRDKLFFFAGFESYRQTIDSGLLQAVVPTEAMRRGDFSDTAYLNAIGRRFGAAGADISGTFPGGRIPASRLDPGMQALMKLIPLPNIDPAGAGQSYNWNQVLTLDQNMYQAAGKVDVNISDYTKLFVRYNRQKELQPFPIQLWWRNAGAIPLPTPIEGKNQSDSIAVNFTKVFSPTVTNEFIFGYTFVDFPNSYQDYNKMKKSTVGYPYQGIFKQDDKIPGFLSWAAPTPGMWLAGGFDPVLFATKHLVTLSNNFSKIVGTHNMKFGAYYGYIVNKQPGNEPSAGLLQFSPWHPLTTGNMLADMALGVVGDYVENTKQIVRDMGWGEFAFFAQDNWKVTRRLTLEYGARFQHMQPWTARNGIGIATWVPSVYSPTAPADSFPGIQWHAINKNVPLSGWATRPLFVAPRVGFAWDVFGTGRTVLRGGYGTFVYHDPQLAAGAMDLPAGVRRTGLSGGMMVADIDRVVSQGSLVFGGETVDSTDDNQPTTYSYSFTISQQLPKRNLWEISYVGNQSRFLVNYGNLANINLPPLGAMLNDPTGNVNNYRPLPNWQDLTVRRHDFNSNYNSLQTSLIKQTGRINYTVAYTWSKAMGIGTVIHGLDRRANYAPLPFDRTHVFASSYVINLPDLVRTGSGFGKAIGNGWQLSGIFQAASGVNLQQNIGGGNFGMNAPFGGGQISGPAILGTNAIQAQPRIICDPRSNLQPGQYVNPSCFAPPIPGSNGQFGVNGDIIFPYLRGPAFWTTDLSVFKNFRIAESKQLQFRASGYNFLNHPLPSFLGGDANLSLRFDAQGQVANPRFGFADNKRGNRVFQLAVKFFF